MVTTGTLTIERATPADTERLAQVIAHAFADMRACEWLVPDSAARQEVLAAQFAIVVEHAIEFGFVDTTTDRSAVAVWIDAGTAKGPPPIPHYARRLQQACGPHAPRLRRLDHLFARHHPLGPAHRHLMFLAASPDRHGQGLGTSLLEHHHAELDARGIPAYLEASNPRNRDLYVAHRYRRRGEPFGLPNGALFWPMWRPGVRTQQGDAQ